MFPSIDSAIAQMEGFGLPGVPATRNNNPGNLVYGDFAKRHGAIGNDGQWAIFPDSTTGFQAMDSLLQSYANQGLTLEQATYKWNGNGANSGAYTDFLSKKTGFDAGTLLKGIGGVLGNATGLPIPGSDTLSVGNAVGSFFGIGWTRIAAFILGIACVIIGLLGFRGTQELVVNVGNKVKTVAETAAIAA